MLKTILVSLLVGNIAFAAIQKQTSTFNSATRTDKSLVATVLVDTLSDASCILQHTSAFSIAQLPTCNVAQEREIAELNSLQRNPQVAMLGQVISGLISYYMLCSAIQFTPDFISMVFEDSIEEASIADKINNKLNPDSEVYQARENIKKVRRYTDAITATVCLPSGAANKKLIEIYKE